MTSQSISNILSHISDETVTLILQLHHMDGKDRNTLFYKSSKQRFSFIKSYLT